MSILFNPTIEPTFPGSTPSNADAELGTTAKWRLVEDIGGSARSFTVDTVNVYSGTYSFKIGTGSQQAGWGTTARPVSPGRSYRVRGAYLSDLTWASGFFIRVQGKQLAPVDGFITYNLQPGTERDNNYDFINNGQIDTANVWKTFEFIYTAPANTYWANFAIYAYGAPSAASLWFELNDFTELPPGHSFRIGNGVVSGTSVNNQIITIPQGRSILFNRISIVVASVVGTVTSPPVLSLGTNATNYDNILSNISLINTVTVGRSFSVSLTGSLPVLTPGAVVTARISTAAVGATTLTYEISVFGDLY